MYRYNIGTYKWQNIGQRRGINLVQIIEYTHLSAGYTCLYITIKLNNKKMYTSLPLIIKLTLSLILCDDFIIH